MLTGITTKHPADTSPWGQLCSDESWPMAEFQPPVTAQQLAAAGLIPWSIRFSSGRSSHTLGWMHPTVLAYLQASEAFLRCGLPPNTGQGYTPGPVIAAEDLPVLEAVLRDSFIGKGWRNERFFLRDRAGGLVVNGAQGPLAVERSMFRPLGLLSASVQLNVTTPEGRVWIGQRAWHKQIDPGLWDAAVAGGLTAGELPLATIRREAWEEAGLGAQWWPHIRPMGRMRVCRLLPDCLHHEQVWVFALRVAADTVLQPQDGEVAGFSAVWPEEILQLYRAGLFNHEAACASFPY